MDSINRLNFPIITGTPTVAPSNTGVQQAGTPGQSTTPFIDVLQKKLEEGSQAAFTKHALNRVVERQINVSPENLERLNQGMQLAQQKGLRDALILIDRDAYIVNAAQSRVITVNGETLKGSVFTNIDGTVIV